MPTTYDAEFSDSISLSEGESSHEAHLYLSESFSFSEQYRVTDQNVHLDDTFGFGETLGGESGGSHTLSDSIAITEQWRAKSDLSRRSDAITFFELWFATSDNIDASRSDAITFGETYSRTKTIAPDRRVFSDSIAFGETYTRLKLKKLSDFIAFGEQWCIQSDTHASRGDAISFHDVYHWIVNGFRDPRNNPVTLIDGSGFQMKGRYRRRQSEVIHFEERFTPVNAFGTPLVFEPCKSYHYVHGEESWAELPGWDDLDGWTDLDE